MKDPSFHSQSTAAKKASFADRLLRETSLLTLKTLRFMNSTALFISLSASLVVFFSFCAYGQRIAPEIVLAGFLVTLSIYSLNKATDRAEDSVNSPKTAPRSQVYYYAVSIAAMLACFTIGAFDGLKVLLVLSMPFVIGLVYSVRVIKTLPRLKEITGAKNLSVALSWATTGALLPEALTPVEFQKVIFVFAFIFFQVLIKEVIFDFLDMKGDKVSGVTTIPMVLGKRRTKLFLVTMNSLSGLLFVFSILSGVIIHFESGSIAGVLFSFVIIGLFTNSNSKRFNSLMVYGKRIPVAGLIKAILR